MQKRSAVTISGLANKGCCSNNAKARRINDLISTYQRTHVTLRKKRVKQRLKPSFRKSRLSLVSAYAQASQYKPDFRKLGLDLSPT